MVPLTTLWLPILLSSVFVFLASSILHMALPFWHRADYGKLPSEGPVLDGLASASSGQYIAPHVNWNKLTKEEREAYAKRPMAFLIVRNPAKMSFGGALGGWFVESLVLSTLAGYIGAVALAPGTSSMAVCRVVGTAGILAYAFQSVSESIWYGRPWSATIKTFIDGVIYGLLTGATFGWLWPR